MFHHIEQSPHSYVIFFVKPLLILFLLIYFVVVSWHMKPYSKKFILS